MLRKLHWILMALLTTMFTMNLQSAPLILDTQEASNSECPGETISLLENTNITHTLTGQGRMNTSWDIDRYSFTPGHAGMVKITIDSPNQLSFKAGTVCNTQDYFRYDDITTQTQQFYIDETQSVFLSIFDWESGGGYDFDLTIEFMPENPDTSSSDEDTTEPETPTPDEPISTGSEGTIIIDTVSNNDCPAETISVLDGINASTNVSGEGIMDTSWDVDKYVFTPAAAGTITIGLTTPEPTTIKAGLSCNSEDFFRSSAKTTHSETFHIDAGQSVNLAMFDWEANGYTYDLSIVYTPDVEPETPNDTTDPIDPDPIDPNPDPVDPPSNSDPISGSMTIDTSSNNECPAEQIMLLEGLITSADVTGQGVMDSSYDIDNYVFTPRASGTVTIRLTTPELTTIKAGSVCNEQDYFRSENKTSHNESFHIDSGQSVNLAMFDWDSNGYTYDLSVQFEPDPGQDFSQVIDNPGDNNSGQVTSEPYANHLSGDGKQGRFGAPSGEDLQNDETVGATRGEFSVNQGSANYSLKIDVPPGRAGMEPKIALDYSSSAGDGYLGKGWGISGLSLITRCGSTKAVDGKIQEVKLNDEDNYCLDGQRLIKIGENPIVDNDIDDPNGVAKVEYRTEIDNYSKIVSYNDNENGPAYWRVWTKSGLVYRYGFTDDADVKIPRAQTLKVGERIISWAVDKISDRVNDTNSIRFSYYNWANNERYIKDIQYTGGAVTFEYENRDSVAPLGDSLNYINGFIAGTNYTLTQRLKNVKVEYKNDQNILKELRNYQLSYINSFSKQFNALESIQEFHIDDTTGTSVALPKLNFTWNNGTYPFWSTNSVGMTSLGSAGGQVVMLADYTGDGRPDYLHKANNIPTASIVTDINGDGFNDYLRYHKDLQKVTVGYGHASGIGAEEDLTTGIGTSHHSGGNVSFADIDGDGDMDIIAPRSQYGVYLSKASRNNGKLQFSAFTKILNVSHPNERINANKPIIVADLNGDGLPEIIHLAYDGVLVSYNKNGIYQPFNKIEALSNYFSESSGWGSSHQIRSFGDVNGDGYLDLIGFKGNDVKVALNTGKDFLAPYTAYMGINKHFPTSDIGKRPRLLADMNNDGKVDIVAFGTDSVVIHSSTGKDFTKEYTNRITDLCTDQGWGVDDFRTVVDWDGDGTLDIVGIKKDGTARYYKMDNQTKHITKFYNDDKDNHPSKTYINQEVTVDYRALNSCYTKSNGMGKSIKDIEFIPAIQVVKYVSTNDGVGGTNKLEYLYSGYRVNLDRGSLGFRSIWTKNHTTDIRTDTYYKQAFPYIGMVDSSDTYYYDDGDKTPISTIENRYTLNARVYYDTEKRHSMFIYMPYIAESTEDDKLLNTTNKTKTVIHNNEYHGNIASITKEITALNGTTYKTVTKNKYQDNENDWIIGRLTESVATHTSLTSTVVKKSSFAYDSTTGMLTKEVIGNEVTGGKYLEKVYSYDSYGNKSRETIRGTGISGDISTHYLHSTIYQGRFLTKITKSINSVEHSENRTYDCRFGTVKSSVDSNGLKTLFSYDGMGKKITERLYAANNQEISSKYWVHRWESAGFTHGLYSVSTYGSDIPFSKIVYDQMAREVGRYAYGGVDGDLRVNTKKSYRKNGKLHQETLPYTVFNTQKVITHGYDDFGRETYISKPNPDADEGGLVGDRISYAGLTTKYTSNAHSATDIITKEVVRNALGKVIKVTDAKGTDDESYINYSYYADGKLHKTTDSKGSVITLMYDNLRNKSQMIDPDLGHWVYEHDALGRVLTVTDAKLNMITYRYDALGRVVTKRDHNLFEHTWLYDTEKVGAVTYEKKMRLSDRSYLYSKEYKYTNTSANPLKAVSKTIEYIEGKYYTTSMDYHSNGKLRDLTYPNGYVVRHHYKNGALHQIEDGTTNDMLYTVEAKDQFGITQARLGNDMVMTQDYDDIGYLQSTNGSFLNTNKIALSYKYNQRGLVKERADTKIGITEAGIVYDRLNRITDIDVTAPSQGETYAQTLKYEYDSYGLGNLTQKNGVQLYYDSTRPHAVSRTSDGRHYSYDANGNMLSDGRQSMEYNPTNKVTRITKGASITTFAYGPSGARYKKAVGNNQDIYTHYVGKLYEKSNVYVNQEEFKEKNFVYFGNKLVKVKERAYKQASNAQMVYEIKDSYMHQDNLGNIIAMTDESGKIINRRSYTPFGEMRHVLYDEAIQQANNLSAQALVTKSLETTNRGFTGHEHINGTDLIHMNGRVYDPTIGRFLSADPHIQAPEDTQSYNRYSYVKNNPLNYTDPSGYFFKGLVKWFKKNWKTVLAIAVAVAIGVYAPGLLGNWIGNELLLKTVVGALAGAASGGIMTGTVEGALQGAKWGAISGATAHLVAEGAAVLGDVDDAHNLGLIKDGAVSKAGVIKAVGHGLSRAKIAQMQYGTGKGAFLSGFVSSGFSVGGDAKFGAVKMAVVGGTVSVIGGGKFANGAMGSAFQYLYNNFDPFTGGPRDIVDDIYGAVEDAYNALKELVSGVDATVTAGGVVGIHALVAGVFVHSSKDLSTGQWSTVYHVRIGPGILLTAGAEVSGTLTFGKSSNWGVGLGGDYGVGSAGGGGQFLVNDGSAAISFAPKSSTLGVSTGIDVTYTIKH